MPSLMIPESRSIKEDHALNQTRPSFVTYLVGNGFKHFKTLPMSKTLETSKKKTISQMINLPKNC